MLLVHKWCGIVDLFLPDVCLQWLRGASTIRPLTIACMLQILEENLFGNWQTLGTCDLARLPGFKFGMPSWRLCCRITIMGPKTTESSHLSYLKHVHQVGLFISEFQYIILFGLGKGRLRGLSNFSARFDLNSHGYGVWHVPCLQSSCRLPSVFCVSFHNSDWMPCLCSGKNYCAFWHDLHPLCMLSWFVSVVHATFDLYQLCTLLCDLYQLCMLSWFISVVYSVLICISCAHCCVICFNCACCLDSSQLCILSWFVSVVHGTLYFYHLCTLLLNCISCVCCQ